MRELRRACPESRATQRRTPRPVAAREAHIVSRPNMTTFPMASAWRDVGLATAKTRSADVSASSGRFTSLDMTRRQIGLTGSLELSNWLSVPIPNWKLRRGVRALRNMGQQYRRIGSRQMQIFAFQQQKIDVQVVAVAVAEIRLGLSGRAYPDRFPRNATDFRTSRNPRNPVAAKVGCSIAGIAGRRSRSSRPDAEPSSGACEAGSASRPDRRGRRHVPAHQTLVPTGETLGAFNADADVTKARRVCICHPFTAPAVMPDMI